MVQPLVSIVYLYFEGSILKAKEKLQSVGQSLWMNHINRKQIYDGSLMQYIADGVISGLVLSSQAICHTMNNSSVYDDGIYKKLKDGLYGESLAIDLILEDLHHAADLLRHSFNQTDGVDGWAVLPLSLLMTSNSDDLLQLVSVLHARLKRENTLITIPGVPEMSGAIEEIVFAGVPINISLIYSCDQYLNAAEAYLRGIERRIGAGLKPAVPCFISISILDLATALSKEMKQLAATEASITIARNIYKTMRILHGSPQSERTYNIGARPFRLIWLGPDYESTVVSDISFYEYLIAPFTVAAMSEQSMGAFINHEHPEALLSADDNGCEEILAIHQKTGLSFKHLAGRLQDDAASHQVKTWITLLDTVARKSANIIQTKPVIICEGEH